MTSKEIEGIDKSNRERVRVSDSEGDPTISASSTSAGLTDSQLVAGLRRVNEFVQALEHSNNVDDLCREAVQFATEELGVERCGLFLVEKDGIRGTWGIDQSLKLVHEGQLFITFEEHHQRWREIREADLAKWTLRHGKLREWRDGRAEVVGEGWCARTAIHARSKLVGILFNDTLKSGAPPDDTLQEILVVFGGLLGQMIEVVRANQNLQRRESQFSALIENLPDIILRFDRDRRIIFASPQIELIIGLPPADIVGRTWHEVTTAANVIESWDRQLKEVFRTGETLIFEFEIPTPHATCRILTRLIPEFKNGESDPATVLGVLSDVTEQRRAEDAVIHSERRYRRAMSGAGLVAYERQLDRNHYNFIGDEIEKFLGVPAAEVTHKSLISMVSEIRLRGKLAEIPFNEAIQKVRSGEIRDWSADICITNRRGEKLWLSDDAVTTWDEQTSSFWVLGFMQDITDRIRVEADLIKSQQRLGLLNRIAKCVHGDLSLKDILGQVLTEVRGFFPDYRVSYSRLHHDGKLEIICSRQPANMPSTEGNVRDCSAVLPELRYAFELLPYTINDCMDSSISDEFRRSIVTTGTRAWLSVSINHDERSVGRLILDSPTPHVWEEEELQTMLEIADYLRLVVNDSVMRERRKDSERELQASRELLLQSQKMDAIARLAGGIAHDFNNLLTVISGNIELMADDLAAENRKVEGIDDVRNAVARASSLTSQLLNYGRRQFVQPIVFRLDERLDTLNRLLRRSIREDIEYMVDIETGVWPIFADPGQIEQMIVNLVDNSCEAMPKGGKLTVTARNLVLTSKEAKAWQGITKGNYVMLAVTDTGIGIDEDAIGKLFDPFYSTKNSPAAGLGLASVFGIVKKFEGDIRVESERGKSTTFRILLPAHEISERSSSDETRVPRDPYGRETILFVEDEASLLAMASRTLRAFGYRVLEANSAKEAISVFDAMGKDVAMVVTDVVMPGMSGPELAKLFIEERPDLPILYVSGYSDEEIVRRGIERGSMSFLAKPFSPRVLGERIRAILDQATEEVGRSSS